MKWFKSHTLLYFACFAALTACFVRAAETDSETNNIGTSQAAHKSQVEQAHANQSSSGAGAKKRKKKKKKKPILSSDFTSYISEDDVSNYVQKGFDKLEVFKRTLRAIEDAISNRKLHRARDTLHFAVCFLKKAFEFAHTVVYSFEIRKALGEKLIVGAEISPDGEEAIKQCDDGSPCHTLSVGNDSQVAVECLLGVEHGFQSKSKSSGLHKNELMFWQNRYCVNTKSASRLWSASTLYNLLSIHLARLLASLKRFPGVMLENEGDITSVQIRFDDASYRNLVRHVPFYIEAIHLINSADKKDFVNFNEELFFYASSELYESALCMLAVEQAYKNALFQALDEYYRSIVKELEISCDKIPGKFRAREELRVKTSSLPVPYYKTRGFDVDEKLVIGAILPAKLPDIFSHFEEGLSIDFLHEQFNDQMGYSEQNEFVCSEQSSARRGQKSKNRKLRNRNKDSNDSHLVNLQSADDKVVSDASKKAIPKKQEQEVKKKKELAYEFDETAPWMHILSKEKGMRVSDSFARLPKLGYDVRFDDWFIVALHGSVSPGSKKYQDIQGAIERLENDRRNRNVHPYTVDRNAIVYHAYNTAIDRYVLAYGRRERQEVVKTGGAKVGAKKTVYPYVMRAIVTDHKTGKMNTALVKCSTIEHEGKIVCVHRELKISEENTLAALSEQEWSAITNTSQCNMQHVNVQPHRRYARFLGNDCVEVKEGQFSICVKDKVLNLTIELIKPIGTPEA